MMKRQKTYCKKIGGGFVVMSLLSAGCTTTETREVREAVLVGTSETIVTTTQTTPNTPKSQKKTVKRPKKASGGYQYGIEYKENDRTRSGVRRTGHE